MISTDSSKSKHKKVPFDIGSVVEESRKTKALFTGATLDGFIEAAKSLSLDELESVETRVTPRERAVIRRLEE